MAPPDFDADTWFGEKGSRRRDHTERKLCRQAEEALREGLASLLDDVLSEVWVIAVEPGGDPHHLLVWLGAPAGLSHEQVQSRLEKVSGRLRSEVADAITRKRAPLLTFVLAPEGVSP